MPRPDLPPKHMGQLIRDLSQTVSRLDRRDAFIDKRRVIAQSGGLAALPVPLVAPNASGQYSVTLSTYSAFISFVGAAYGSLWVLLATNGASSTDFTAQLIFPNQANAVLATSTYVETHPTLGPVYRVAFTENATLAAATGAYATTITLQAKTANSTNTNLFRVLAAGWGSANV